MTFTQMLTLSEAAPIVIDGGLGSAAEDRGIDLGHALWSAELIRRDPDTLLAVHSAFADAGARILTTASYQATPTGFVEAGISVAEGNRIITDSVRVARSAAERRDVLTAGSVGPYGAALGHGAEYTGDYRLSSSEYTAFHRPRIAALAEAGADLLAIETQPRLDEIAAIIGLTDETGLPSWVTVTLQTGTDTNVPTLPDGSTLAELAEAAAASASVQAIGVNCVRPSLVTPALRELSRHTDLPLIAYPNSGEIYDANTLTWRDGAEAGVGSWPVAEWTRLGARIIGGCCRVRPEDIAVLTERTRA
ncbi:homocysteine S-methyltransferase [Brevibacterium linens]|uniref:Homocysteine S-methyltransferase n=1 Tax=Brevibacterium linens ATCC 9172 TaxID=1255617 RepID=A0A2H1IK55_BRELN|nr:homocysteine S-methyltransferase [Brevibacterium linens]KAB1948317.1 homocysteine S-methyltransferase [Brevibacterium linens ATCC 9172]SMX75579.1 homocysteine S-methyltransferase [Brevibacterium linens ATCC 9172]